MRDVLQNTARKFKIYMADSATPTQGKTGLTSFTVYLAKEGLAESMIEPTIVERGHGWYEVTPLAAHRDTLGDSAWTFVAAGAVDFVRLETVVAVDAQSVRYGAAAAGDAMTLTAGQRVKLDATQPDYAPSKAGDAMTLDSAVLTALFSDVDTAALVASIVSHFDEATDLPADTIATLAATRTISGLAAAISNIAAAKAAAEAIQAKLPTTSHLAGSATNAGHAVLDTETLKRFVTEDTGETTAAAGSVAKLAQGAGGSGGEADWTAEERAQIRYRLGLNGTATAPTEPTPTPIVITPGADNITTAWLVTRVAGVATEGITIRYQQAQEPDSDTGSSYDATIYDVVSGTNAVAEMPVVKGGYYYVWRGTGKRPESAQLIEIPSDAGATYELPSHVGR